jgi:hypothetical protein
MMTTMKGSLERRSSKASRMTSVEVGSLSRMALGQARWRERQRRDGLLE